MPRRPRRDRSLDRHVAPQELRTTQGATPIALVPSDGNELAMVGLEATVTIEGPLAHTELHFTFVNPERARARAGSRSPCPSARRSIGLR